MRTGIGIAETRSIYISRGLVKQVRGRNDSTSGTVVNMDYDRDPSIYPGTTIR